MAKETLVESLDRLSPRELRRLLSEGAITTELVNHHYSDKGGHKARSDYHKAHRRQGLLPKRW